MAPVSYSRRGRRRERARGKARERHAIVAKVKRLCDNSMLFSMETWGGTRCPECGRSVPPHALFGWSYSTSDMHCHGVGVMDSHCHRDRTKCTTASIRELGRQAWLFPLVNETCTPPHGVRR